MKDSPTAVPPQRSVTFATAWIARTLGDPRQTESLSAAGVAEVLQCAQDEGVAALLFRALSSQSGVTPPASLLQPLFDLHARAVAVEMLRRAETQRVLDRLQQTGIPFLILKGAALSQWAYPDAYLRARDDLDLLFADHAAASQACHVLAALGYDGDELPSNGPQFERNITYQPDIGPTWHIDIHWRLSSHPVFADRFSFDELFAASMALSQGGRGLGPVHALLHASIHRVLNLMIGQGDRLIWLYDFHQLSSLLDASDWIELQRCAVQRSLCGPLSSAMSSSERLLGTTWPEDLVKRLSAQAITEAFKVDQSHDRGYFEWQSALTLPVMARGHLLLRKFIPTTRYMLERYELQHRWQLPAAYLRRWSKGVAIALQFIRHQRR